MVMALERGSRGPEVLLIVLRWWRSSPAIPRRMVLDSPWGWEMLLRRLVATPSRLSVFKISHSLVLLLSFFVVVVAKDALRVQGAESGHDYGSQDE